MHRKPVTLEDKLIGKRVVAYTGQGVEHRRGKVVGYSLEPMVAIIDGGGKFWWSRSLVEMVEEEDMETCGMCRGSGDVVRLFRPAMVEGKRVCPHCKGTGKQKRWKPGSLPTPIPGREERENWVKPDFYTQIQIDGVLARIEGRL